jgi:N-acetylglucosaminyldiphosphoundecaprenol N-acetyl-beta-D-mannosaminyltransferase
MYAGRLAVAAQHVIEICTNGEKRNRCVSATGAHGLVTAKHDLKFRAVLEDFYLNLPDGKPSVWVGRLKGRKQMERCYGPDFFEAVIRGSADRPVRHFFCGGKEGVAEELKKVCAEKMGNKNVAGCFSPPFREMTDDEMKNLGDTVTAAKTDILWIGLSTPKQELFAAKIAEYVKVHFIVAVGAAFDFYTGRVKQAPRFMQRAGLEWFFRLCMEPERLYKRYIKIVPLFIFYNIMETFLDKRRGNL